MTQLRLYTRPDCHLCELADALLREAGRGADVLHVNIEDELGLLHRYGVHIPVLQRMDSGAELGWPFDAAALQKFLEADQ